MSAYNFQRQFATKIKSGMKCSTIRARRKNGYLPLTGESIKLYTGMRTRQCELIAEVVVNRTRPIQINSRTLAGDIEELEVVLAADRLNPKELHALALSDGFENVESFAKFFRDNYGDSLNAFLIEWRPIAPGKEQP